MLRERSDPGQYHPRQRMGSGELQSLRLIPFAYANGTDSIPKVGLQHVVLTTTMELESA